MITGQNPSKQKSPPKQQSSSSPKNIVRHGHSFLPHTPLSQDVSGENSHLTNNGAFTQLDGALLQQDLTVNEMTLQSKTSLGSSDQKVHTKEETTNQVTNEEEDENAVTHISPSASESQMHSLATERNPLKPDGQQIASAHYIMPNPCIKAERIVTKSRSKTLNRRQDPNLYGRQPSSSKQRQLNDLVLQVFADKKHNRRQTAALHQGLHYSTVDGASHASSAVPMQKHLTANSDIPFVLTQYKSSIGKDSAGSFSGKEQPPKRQTVKLGINIQHKDPTALPNRAASVSPREHSLHKPHHQQHQQSKSQRPSQLASPAER